MKALKLVYNQIGIVFLIVVGWLFYVDKLQFNWLTVLGIIVTLVLILTIGKLISSK